MDCRLTVPEPVREPMVSEEASLRVPLLAPAQTPTAAVSGKALPPERVRVPQ